MSKEMKRVWHINMQKKYRKFDDLKSFQSCLKVLYTLPPPTHIMPLFPFLQQVAEGNKKWYKVFITTYPVFQFSIGCTLITDSITFGSTSVIVLVAAWDSTRVFVLLSYNRGIRVTSLATVSCWWLKYFHIKNLLCYPLVW